MYNVCISDRFVFFYNELYNSSVFYIIFLGYSWIFDVFVDKFKYFFVCVLFMFFFGGEVFIVREMRYVFYYFKYFFYFWFGWWGWWWWWGWRCVINNGCFYDCLIVDRLVFEGDFFVFENFFIWYFFDYWWWWWRWWGWGFSCMWGFYFNFIWQFKCIIWNVNFFFVLCLVKGEYSKAYCKSKAKVEVCIVVFKSISISVFGFGGK